MPVAGGFGFDEIRLTRERGRSRKEGHGALEIARAPRNDAVCHLAIQAVEPMTGADEHPQEGA